ncbi:hypothetical protein Taro_033067 [Colocasia esculenta]|uniref:Pectinesterase n=1 Tax=Colocasia esculenta TaxID=4460 RepID=A0A843VSX7_COLES|nr:hypothetical protein [Colocasia esculenta]
MFQDFGPLTERRRLERQQRRKRLIVAGVSGVIFLLLLVVGALATLHVSAAGNSSATMPSSTTPPKEIHSTTRTIKMLCSSTDYKSTCVSSLSKAVNSSRGSSSSKLQPKDLIKAAVVVVTSEVAQAFSHSELIKSDDPKVKGAIEDCKELYNYAKDELKRTADGLGKNVLQQLPKREHELKNWLSAVMSYQQTCIDGFPEGEFKTNMKKAMTKAKELTSNALAIISEASSLLSSLDIQGLGLGRRRLLSREGGDCPGCQVSHKDGLPAWVSDADRRLLKQQQAKKLKPNVVVAKDGSGNFKTISEALAAMPAKYKGRYVIYVKAGIYDESPTVTKNMMNVTMYGDGSRKTIVNGNKNFVDGTRTFQTATFVAIGEGFMAIDMGFRNSAGAVKHQAVALRVQSDRAIFLNCRMEGYQDTLYAQTHRQYYRSCVVAGTVDFIFGDAAAIFQNCNLVVRRPLDNQQNIVTAQGRVDRRQSTGFVIQSCRFIADKKLKVAGAPPIRSYLGRPWKEYSRTIIMESTIGDFIHPDGYMPWEGDFALKTLYYGEYGNKGPGAGLAKRVSWPGFRVINKQEAVKYTVASFIQGDDWIKATGTPVRLGLYN